MGICTYLSTCLHKAPDKTTLQLIQNAFKKSHLIKTGDNCTTLLNHFLRTPLSLCMKKIKFEILKGPIHDHFSQTHFITIIIHLMSWTYVMIWLSAPASTRTPSTNSGTEEKLCCVHCLPSSKLILHESVTVHSHHKHTFRGARRRTL